MALKETPAEEEYRRNVLQDASKLLDDYATGLITFDQFFSKYEEGPGSDLDWYAELKPRLDTVRKNRERLQRARRNVVRLTIDDFYPLY